MKQVTLSLMFVLLLGFASVSAAADVQDVQKAITEAGAEWTAGYTSLSHLSADEFAEYCSWEFGDPPAPMSYINEIEIPKDMPAHLDWRNIDGENFMTPIKDQHPCGTCATFSSIAAFESLIKIAVGNAFVEPDLSEQHVYSCEGPLPYTLFHPMIYLKNSGAPDETCMPYNCDFAGERPSCQDTCADWDARSFQTTDYRFFMWPNEEQIIAALQDGPIIAGMQVYEDFQDYTGGIYEHVTGKILGGHGVALIGYDKDEQYWIIKNSWGTEWGEEGYARLRWQTGMLRFSYQSVDVQVDYETLCGADTAPAIDGLAILNAVGELPEDADLEISFTYADGEANLRGGELFYAIDDEDALRFAEPMRELVGTSEAARDEPFTLMLPGPFASGEHTLAIYVSDLCGLVSNEVTIGFQVAGTPTDDDDSTMDDDTDIGDDDDDTDAPADDDDDDDNDDSGCGK
ncbi:MAG: C1 family peptidase [Candidatus Lernaella stagnicola]|nr:C1 family peptidase [Candidatus Lernaella stagnicola]